ncbi:DNA-processing protein DprA [Nitrospina gracilis]|uniref:DNA-processing protein DprA n=1 Tax=Nitrospina gracilis TaxID=35801 RepID=UPI001F01B4DD|nr:DNA processing protein [Nitrospina gracilis Nb-211]
MKTLFSDDDVSAAERYWVALNMVLGVGKTLFHRLVNALGSPRQVFHATRQQLMQVEGIGAKTAAQIQNFDLERNLEREYRLMDNAGVRVLTLEDPRYPPLLKAIYDPPPVLYFKGRFFDEVTFPFAVVGTRAASSYGKIATERLCSELASRGACLISGMARGVDTIVHKAALKEKAVTLAVMGCGLEHTYPPENRALKEKIVEAGAIISEFPMSTKPDRNNFPARNRVISGLAHGTLVIEAGEKSGALITAHFALEQGREVFALPGNIFSPKSQGAHNLIKKGAKLVDGVDAILEEFSADVQQNLALKKNDDEKIELTDFEKLLLSLIGHEQHHVDELIERSQLPAADVLATLVQLELKDRVAQTDGLWHLARFP